jgi:hypothetical protein
MSQIVNSRWLLAVGAAGDVVVGPFSLWPGEGPAFTKSPLEDV